MSCQVLRTGNVWANDAYNGVACNGLQPPWWLSAVKIATVGDSLPPILESVAFDLRPVAAMVQQGGLPRRPLCPEYRPRTWRA
jgi:hypothetical protein